MNCTNCGIALEAGARFCLDCGTEVPQVKACVKCGVQLSPTAKFCSQCGAKQDGSGSTGGLAMGNKNVVAGDVIGSKEETHIAGHATIIKNEDETKKIVKCHECGKWMQVIEGYECRKCHQFTCPSCYNTSARSCHCCFQEEAVQKAPLEDQKSAMKVELMESERMILERAWTLLYEKDRPRQALALVEPLYQEHREDEAVLEVYLPILAWCNPQLAVELADSLCHVEGYKVQIEEAIRRRDTVQAERRLQEAKERWPGQVSLQLLEVVVKIAQYRDYKEELFLEEGRRIMATLTGAESPVECSWQHLLEAFLNSEGKCVRVTFAAFKQRGLCWHVVSRLFFLLYGFKLDHGFTNINLMRSHFLVEQVDYIACWIMMVYPDCFDSDTHYIAGTQGNLVEGEAYKADGSRLSWRFEYRYDSQGNLVEEKTYKADGSLSRRSEYRYDSQGNRVEQKGYEADGSLSWRNEYRYDSQGNRVEEKYYEDGSLSRRSEYRYDSQGNRVEQKGYEADGSLSWRNEYRYDSQGNRVEEKYYEDGSLSRRSEYRYDSQGNRVEQKGYEADGSLKEEWIYSQGNLVEQKYYEADGSLSSRFEYRYDSQGNRVKGKYYKYYPDGSLSSRSEYRYDSQGNRVEEYEYEYYPDGSLKEEWIYSQGNLVEKKYYKADGSLSSRFEYRYDSQGNLVEEKEYGADGRLWERSEYRYDSQGNRVEEKYYGADGRLWGRSESRYDSQGNLVEEKEYEDGRLSSRSEYRYDSQGNRVEKKEYEYEYYPDGRLWGRSESRYDSQGNLVEEKEYEY